MRIKELLLEEHSKANSTKIVEYIGCNPAKFNELFSLFIKNEKVVSQRAATTLGHCIDKTPELITPHIDQLVENLSKPDQHVAIYRASMRTLQSVPIPEHLQGIIFDICLDFIMSEKQAIAVRAFSITAANNIAKPYPELLSELKSIVKDLSDHESGALRVRSRQVLSPK